MVIVLASRVTRHDDLNSTILLQNFEKPLPLQGGIRLCVKNAKV